MSENFENQGVDPHDQPESSKQDEPIEDVPNLEEVNALIEELEPQHNRTTRGTPEYDILNRRLLYLDEIADVLQNPKMIPGGEVEVNNFLRRQYKAYSELSTAVPRVEPPTDVREGASTESREANFGHMFGGEKGVPLALLNYFKSIGWRNRNPHQDMYAGMSDYVDKAANKDREGLAEAVGKSIQHGLYAIKLARTRMQVGFLSPGELEKITDTTTSRYAHLREINAKASTILGEEAHIPMHFLRPFDLAFNFHRNNEQITLGDSYTVIKQAIVALNDPSLNEMLAEYERGRQELLGEIYASNPGLQQKVESYKSFSER